MGETDRVVVLVDMDCFYCQVEEKLNPSLAGQPMAVVQYNLWKGGGIIAVNYPARERGVTRHMRGNEAKKHCPEIALVTVPNIRGKADLTKYREAGKRVAEVLQTFTPLLQRASVDEAYLDITKAVENHIENMVSNLTPDLYTSTFVVGSTIKDFLHNVNADLSINEKNLKLAVGAFITEKIRSTVYEKTGYHCSAGIAHNKILAKLACGLNKPNKQTVLPEGGLNELYNDLPLKKIRGLGGKFGDIISRKLNIATMGELSSISEAKLRNYFDDKTANWLYNISRGIDLEPVTVRLISKSIGCCKQFRGKTALTSIEAVTHWLNELAEEMSERLEMDLQENNRKAKQIIVSFAQQINNKDVSSTRTVCLASYEKSKIVHSALGVIKKHCELPDGGFHIKYMGVSAGNFEDIKNVRDITSYFKPHCNNAVLANTNDNLPSSKSESNSQIISTSTAQENVSADDLEEIDGDINDHQNYLLNAFEANTHVDLPGKKSENNSQIASTSTAQENVYGDELEEMDGGINDDNYQVSDESEENFHNTLDEFTSIHTNMPNFSEENGDSKFEDEERNTNLAVANFQPEDDENSLDNEIFLSTENESKQKSAPSFFTSYLNSVKNKSPVKRNFDTSIILQELSDAEESGSEIEKVEENNIADRIDDSNESIILPTSSADNEFQREMCAECNQLILRSESQSHMDYHYALKLIKEEKESLRNKPLVSNTNKTKETPKLKNGKRKRSVRDNIKDVDISSYFTMNNGPPLDTVETCEVCEECGKRIHIKDVQSHKDYHIAKKLHVELNPVKTLPVNNSKVQNKSKAIAVNSDKMQNKSKTAVKIKTVTSFFKPV